MKINYTRSSDGSLQFVVSAENGAEQVVLRMFQSEVERQDRKVCIHGFTSVILATANSPGLGPASFNFGTRTDPNYVTEDK